jgi:SulP family sulfate permease
MTAVRSSSLAIPDWLRAYEARWWRPDLVAGLTLFAFLLPAGIGNASLAGLAPQAGLYACLFSGLVFWLFCSSKQTAVTTTSGLSLLVAASVGALSGGDPVRHAALAASVTLMIGSIALLAWLVRAGNAVGFFSETVLVGFKAGLAFYLASTQLPDLFGFKGARGDFWERSAYFIGHLGDTHRTSMLLGVAALAVLLAGKRWMKRSPVSFLVVVGGIVAAQLLNLEAQGVALLGEVPRGLPSMGLPAVSRSELNALVPVALAAFVLAAVETAAIGRMFSQKHANRFDANREILAIGAANLLSGLGRGFPVSGGMSQSLVNESAGARTPLSGLIAAVLMLIVALFASGLLRNLPQPVLAAVVLAAVTGLVDIAALRHIWHFSRREFLVAMAALAGVLGSGPVNGVLLGAAISIVLLLRQAANPRVTELARVPDTTHFADRVRHPENDTTPGVFVFRCEASLLYFNVEYVRDRLFELLAARQDSVRLVVFYLGVVPGIDLAGAELIADLHRTFLARGVAFRVADVHGEVRGALRRVGFERDYGSLESGQTIDRVVSAWQLSPAPATGMDRSSHR